MFILGVGRGWGGKCVSGRSFLVFSFLNSVELLRVTNCLLIFCCGGLLLNLIRGIYHSEEISLIQKSMSLCVQWQLITFHQGEPDKRVRLGELCGGFSSKSF